MKPEDFNRMTSEFIGKALDDVSDKAVQDRFQLLLDHLKSPDTVKFTQQINDMYQSRNIRDVNDNPLVITNPVSAIEQASKNGNLFQFTLSEEEDRWFRANELYGDRILTKLGLKYNSD